MEETVTADLLYPHVEIAFVDGCVELALNQNPEQRAVIMSSSPQKITSVVDAARKLLPAVTSEALEYADDVSVEFVHDEPELKFDKLLAQVQKLAGEFTVPAVAEITPELEQVLISNWQSDVFVSFRRAIVSQIITISLREAHAAGEIENFVLAPGEFTEYMPWFISDMETLGYELQVKLDS